MIKSIVRGQSLQIAHPLIVTGTLNYLEMEVIFKTPDWEGLSKWVHFRNEAGEEISPQNLDSNNMLTKDNEIDLTTGVWTVWIHGTSPSADGVEVTRITTNEDTIEVQNTGIDGDHPLPKVSPEVAEQLDSKIQNALSTANDAKSTADEALNAVKDVEGYSTDAKRFMEEAKLAAEHAKTSESNSSDSSTNAYNSAVTAQSAANAAQSAADNALLYSENAFENSNKSDESANRAIEAAKNATASETAANDSAKNAKVSEENAKASEESVHNDSVTASNAAISSEKYATSAKSSASEALNYKNSIEQDANDVAFYHGHVVEMSANVDNKANIAVNAQQEAAKSAEKAKTSEDNAKTSEDNAKTSESNADISEANAKSSEDNARASELSADEDARKAMQALADLLKMLGTDIATLVNGKIPVDQIPSIATTEIYVCSNQEEEDAITGAERGDILIRTDKAKSYIWKDTGWVYLVSPTDYVAKAGYAETAGTAENATKINGHRMIEMTKSQFDTAVKDPETYYLVYQPKAEV